MSSEYERPVTRDALRVEPDTIAKRSASSTIITGVAATGILAGGLGQLAGGAAKLKDTLSGGGKQPAAPADPPKAEK